MSLKLISLAAALITLSACAAADDASGSDGDESDLTSSGHLQALTACTKAETTSLSRDNSSNGKANAYKATEACVKKANEKLVAQLNKRAHVATTSERFETFRNAQNAFCYDTQDLTHGDAVILVGATQCRRNAEITLALLLQRYGQLGGTVQTAPCAQFACPTRQAAIKACYDARVSNNTTLEDLNKCQRTALFARLAQVSSRYGGYTTGTDMDEALKTGADVCDNITLIVGRPAADPQANAKCRSDVAATILQVLN